MSKPTSSTSTSSPTAAPTTGSTAPTMAPTTPVTHERVAVRAYENWVKRGRPAGTPEQDWLKAEQELRAETKNNNRR